MRQLARVRLLRPLALVMLLRPLARGSLLRLPASGILRRPLALARLFLPPARVGLLRPRTMGLPVTEELRTTDFLTQFSDAVTIVSEALLDPGALASVGLQEQLAHADAVAVLARALDWTAYTEHERAERLLSVAENRPRQPTLPPPLPGVTPRGSVATQLATPAADPIAAKAKPASPAVAAFAPKAAPATPPQGPRPCSAARSLVPRQPSQPPAVGRAAPVTPPQGPSAAWSSGSGSWRAASSSGWGTASNKWTSASTVFTAKLPITISDSRSQLRGGRHCATCVVSGLRFCFCSGVFLDCGPTFFDISVAIYVG